MSELEKLKAELIAEIAALSAWVAHLHKHTGAPPVAQDDPPVTTDSGGGPGEPKP